MSTQINTKTDDENSRDAAGTPRIGIIFALIIVAYFLDVVDFSIVQVALPSIRTEFGISLAESQWVIGAYGITLAGLLMVSGRAGDIYSQKRIFIGGVMIFTLASLAGGLAPSFPVLVVFRALQGAGAAMSTVTALAIMIALFPEGPARNRAFGIFAAVLSAGFAAGSVLGGVLTVSLGWRSVMFVNVPIGIIASLISVKFIPSSRYPYSGKNLDLPGAATITAGLVLLVYALTNAGNSYITFSGTILPLVLAFLLLAGFILIESRSRSPLIPLGFLRRGSVLTANLLGLVLASTLVGPSFMVTIFLQQILDYSALYAGLGLLPGAIIFFIVGGWGASWLVNKFGVKKVLVASTILIPGGILLLTRMSVGGNYFQVLPGMVMWSIGASMAFPALSAAAFSGIRAGEEGLASGFINTTFRVGFPLGLAILLIVSGRTDNMADPAVSPAAVIVGFRYALITAAAMGLLCLFLALRIKEPPKEWNNTNPPPSG